MEAQRVRNLTTKRLHTEVGHVYQDIEALTRAPGIMTHQIPNALRALEPFLKEKVQDPRFWDGEYDPTHDGEVTLEPMTDSERNDFFDRVQALPSPLLRIGTGSHTDEG